MTDLRTAAQQALKILELEGWGYPSPKTAEAITALKAALVEDAMQKFTDVNQELEAALAEPPVDDPHRDHWVAIAEAAQKIAASKECGLVEAKALCAALDRLTDAALAEPVQDPVAWRTFDGEGGYDYRTYEDNEDYAAEWAKRNPRHVGWVEPLYTAPPQRKLLTREEAIALWADKSDGPSNGEIVSFARAIERAHGIV